MPKLSKEQIKHIEEIPLTQTMRNSVNLMCDGYRISLQDRLIGRQVRTQLFVNSEILGKWFVDPENHPEIKFYKQRFMRIKKSPYSKKTEAIETIRNPDFASIGQALRHLNSVCESVEPVVDVDAETQRHRDALFATLSEGDDQ